MPKKMPPPTLCGYIQNAGRYFNARGHLPCGVCEGCVKERTDLERNHAFNRATAAGAGERCGLEHQRSMIPTPVVWMLAGGAAVVGLLVVHELRVDAAEQRGRQIERQVWVDAQRQANDKAAADRERTRRTAQTASATHEAARAAITAARTPVDAVSSMCPSNSGGSPTSCRSQSQVSSSSSCNTGDVRQRIPTWLRPATRSSASTPGSDPVVAK